MSLPQSLLALLPPPAPVVPGLPTGVEALDAALVGGGFPPGRLTEIAGARGSGTATLLRHVVEATIARAGWVACIDAARTLAPRDWAHLGAAEGFWMIRPRDPARAAWCADVLLRCSAFTLVVIDSAPRLTRAIAVRLTRLARESNAALVVVSEEDTGVGGGGGGSSMLGGAVRLRLRRGRGAWDVGHGERPRKLQALRSPPHAPNTRTLKIVVEKGGGGSHRTVEVSCAIGVARRLCAHSQVPDRRGVARRAPGGPGGERRAAPAAFRGGDGTTEGRHVGDGGRPEPNERHEGSRVLARKRRCAEPDYGTGDAAHALRAAPPVALG